MKYLKMLGLAAVAAAALTAFAGAGTASATVICKNNLSTSSCNEPYPAGTKGKASLQGSALIESGGSVLVTCTESIVESTLENPGSATTTVKSGLSTLTFGGCSSVVSVLNPGSAELHWISGTDNGTLTTFNTKVTTQIFGVSCSYGASSTGTDVGTTEGGNPGSMTLNTSFPKLEGGFLCPASVVFKGKYVATSPTNAWVAAG